MTRITKITALAGIAFALGGGTAMAQESPADEVYNPNNEVLGVVDTGTPTPTPTATTAPESGTAPTTASAPSKGTDEAAPAATATPAAATPSTETQQASTGDLPFTGFEAGFVALAGLALLGGGLAMRRAARDQS